MAENGGETEGQKGKEWFSKLMKATFEMHSSEEILKCYNEAGDIYEKHIKSIDYGGPQETAKTLIELYPTNRENIRILDVAAGTGMAAIELVKHGFKLFDAVEPSEVMLERAKKTGLYGRYLCDLVGNNKLDLESDKYDVIIIVGGLSAIATTDYVSGMKELTRTLKKGGYIVITTMYEHFPCNGEPESDIEKNFKNIEKSGLWTFVSKRKCSYLSEYKGALAVLRKN